jgi:hypothetical protein
MKPLFPRLENRRPEPMPTTREGSLRGVDLKTMKKELPRLLRGLQAQQRKAGIPVVPMGALAHRVGIHVRTIYKLSLGGRCSDALATRLLYVLGQINRGELIFEKRPGIRLWQARHLSPEETAKRNIVRVISGAVEITSSGPRLRLIRLL